MILAAILTHQNGVRPSKLWVEANIGPAEIRPFAVEPGNERVFVALAAMEGDTTRLLGYTRLNASHAPLITSHQGITLEGLTGGDALDAIDRRRLRNNPLAEHIYLKLGGKEDDDFRVVEAVVGPGFAIFHYVVMSDEMTEDESGVRSANRHLFLVRCKPDNWQCAVKLLPLGEGILNGVCGYIEGEETPPGELPEGFVAAPLVRITPS